MREKRRGAERSGHRGHGEDYVGFRVDEFLVHF